MRVLYRLAALVAVAAGTVLLAGHVLLPWLGGPALQGGCWRDLVMLTWTEQARAEAIRARTQAVQNCLEHKRAIAELVRDGKLTLPEATQRFRELHSWTDDGYDPVLGAYQGVAESDEAICRNVIRWVEVEVRDQPGGQEIVHRLERELAKLTR